jgi:hypothetical protein
MLHSAEADVRPHGPSPRFPVAHEVALDDYTVITRHRAVASSCWITICFAGSTSIIERAALTHRLDLLCGLRICILASLHRFALGLIFL